MEPDEEDDWEVFVRQAAGNHGISSDSGEDEAGASTDLAFALGPLQRARSTLADEASLEVHARALIELPAELPALGKRSVGRPNLLLEELLAGAGPAADNEVAPYEPASSTTNAETAAPPTPQASVSIRVPPPAIHLPDVPPSKLQQNIGGLSLPCSLAQPLSQVVACLQSSSEEPDEVLDGLVSKYLSHDFFLVSGQALESMFQMELKDIKLRLHRLACCLCLLERQARWNLEQGLVTLLPKTSLTCYIDFSSYDETPMVTAAKLKSDRAPKSQVPQLLPAGLALLSSLKSGVANPVVAAKHRLLQIKSGYGILVKSTGIVQDRVEHLFFIGRTTCPLQTMGKNNAQSTKECLQRVSGPSMAAKAFALKSRSVVLDKGSANFLAEHNISLERGDQWATMLLNCHTHIISTCQGKVFNTLFADEVSGLIRVALAIREGGRMALFREALRIQVRKRVKFIPGQASADAVQYRNHMLNLFLAGEPNALQRTMLLMSAANGDWRHEHLEHYYPRGTVPDLGQLTVFLETSIVAALGSHQPRIWPRHRWTGSEGATNDLCILLVCHNLLSYTFQCFMDLVAGHVSGSNGDSTPLASGPILSGEGNPAPTVDIDISELVLQQAEGGVGESVPTSSNDHAARNAQVRVDAWNFLQSQPLPKLLMMKLALHPFAELMQKQLFLGSTEFECQQRVKLAELLLTGRGQVTDRDYCLVVAAEGGLEKAFLEHIQDLMSNSSHWQHFPDSNYTIQFRAFCFRTLQKAAAVVFKLLQLAHECFPLKVFKLVKEPERATEFDNIKACLKDPWVLQLQNTYGSLGHPDVMASLLSQAMVQLVDIADVEARHASIRRQLTAKSIQTWRLGMTHASAEWVLQNYRRWKAGVAGKPSKDFSKRKASAKVCGCGSNHLSLAKELSK
eukprot:6492163-Amphidinium_carterae.3